MSPLPRINFADIKGPEPVPAGEYLVEVQTAVEAVSKAGNPKISLRLRIVGGAFDGKNIFDDLTFTENSMFRIKQFMIATGSDPEFEGDVDVEEFIGKTVMAKVVIDQGRSNEEGELYPPQNRVKKYFSAESTSLEDLM